MTMLLTRSPLWLSGAATYCSRCGGRLFYEAEKTLHTVYHYKKCCNCGRSFDLSGKPTALPASAVLAQPGKVPQAAR